MENRPPPREAERAANWPGVQTGGSWTPDHFLFFLREPAPQEPGGDATGLSYTEERAAIPALKPLKPQPSHRAEADEHFLFRCHRIALDFGPAAAERALAYYERRGKI